MIDLIYDFLTGGRVYTSLFDLFSNFGDTIIKFFNNVANIFLTPIVNLIFALVPFDNNLLFLYLQRVFSAINPYVCYMLDALIIPKEVLNIVIVSFIFRVIIRKDTFITKILLKWYHHLVP